MRRNVIETNEMIWDALTDRFLCDQPFTIEQAGRALTRDRIISGRKSDCENRILATISWCDSPDIIEIDQGVFVFPLNART